LLVHATGTSSVWFRPVVPELSKTWRVIAFDRPGWGRSAAPVDYRKTSIPEQAIATAAVLREQGAEIAHVAGVGFGAVVALELALAEPDMVERAVLLEPPVLDTQTEATEGMSDDVAAIRDAAAEDGEAGVWELFLSGGLPTLGAGAARLGADADPGPGAAHTLLVELPAVPAWPLDPGRAGGLEVPVVVATAPSSPPLLVEAADALARRLPGSERLAAERDGPSGLAGLLRGP
jgi:pimeloyl-ACP methyl ester carboxylesterase